MKGIILMSVHGVIHVEVHHTHESCTPRGDDRCAWDLAFAEATVSA